MTEVGLAHISRTLAVAEELHKRKHKVLFALPKRRQHIFKKSTVQFVDIHGYIDRESIEIVKVVKDNRKIARAIRDELELIDEYKPDAVIVDTRLTVLFSAALRKAKVFSLGGSDGVPGFSYVPANIFPRINVVIKPVLRVIATSMLKNVLRSLHSVAAKFGSLNNLENIINKTVFIVPEIETYFPFNHKSNLQIYYVDPISWNGFNTELPKYLYQLKPDGKTVYVTFGGTGFDGDKLISISKTLLKNGFKVIVTTGELVPTSSFPKDKNLFVSKFLPGQEVVKHVDLVVCHGGYGTVMEAILAGKPVINIPFNPDQLLQSGRITELGLGESIVHLNFKDIINILNFSWDKVQTMVERVTADELILNVKKIIENYKFYQENIKNLTSRIHKKDGAVESADIIERLT